MQHTCPVHLVVFGDCFPHWQHVLSPFQFEKHCFLLSPIIRCFLSTSRPCKHYGHHCNFEYKLNSCLLLRSCMAFSIQHLLTLWSRMTGIFFRLNSRTWYKQVQEKVGTTEVLWHVWVKRIQTAQHNVGVSTHIIKGEEGTTRGGKRKFPFSLLISHHSEKGHVVFAVCSSASH